MTLAITPTSTDVQAPLAIACSQPPWTVSRRWRRWATGGGAQLSQPENPVEALRISELTSENRFASAAILLEKESAPTRITRAVPRRNNDRSREDFGPRILIHRVRLPGQEGFIGLQPAALEDRGIGRDLVAGPQDQYIVQHDVGGGILHGPVTQDSGKRGLEDREAVRNCWRGTPVQRLLRRCRGCQPEEGVLPAAQQKQDDKTRPHDRVEQSQHIGADNLPKAAAGCVRYTVGKAMPHPGGDSPPDRPAAAGPVTRRWRKWTMAPGFCHHPLIVTGAPWNTGDAPHRNDFLAYGVLSGSG